MNCLIKRGFLVVACSIGAGLSQSSIAAEAIPSAKATAVIDWSHLKLSVTGVNGAVPKVVFSDQATYLNSSASLEHNEKTTRNWTATTQITADVGENHVNTIASPLSFSGNVKAMDDGYVSSYGERFANFYFDGPGVLTVSVPYTISIIGCCLEALVTGYGAFVGDEPNTLVDYSGAGVSLDSFSASQSQSGTLLFHIDAGQPRSGVLVFEVHTDGRWLPSPIPEPESYAMLLTGLGLMGAIIRCRSVNRNA